MNDPWPVKQTWPPKPVVDNSEPADDSSVAPTNDNADGDVTGSTNVMKKRYVSEQDNDKSAASAPVKKTRVKKKMYALLIAYCGQGYLGLQRNIGSATIEEEIMNALKKVGALNDEEFAKQQLVNFQRAARTDKGVSALRQVISLEMREDITADELNMNLPDKIRVLAVKRVTKSFNSKNTCDYRTYSYTCPSFAFAPKDIRYPDENYRISDTVLQRLQQSANDFVGSHNFHNFTSGRKPHDPSCYRHMMHSKWEEPVVVDGLELITYIVKGRSFMLHQIRKMVGTMMTICRGYLEPEVISRFFNPNEATQLPIAPAVGLLLEQVHYDWYNKKFGENGIHEKLDFCDVEETVRKFREQHIYPLIMKAEKEEKTMLEYLEKLHSHYEEFQDEENMLDSKTDSDTDIQKNQDITVSS